MELRRIAVIKKSSNYKEVKDLMKRAFPKNERMPMWLLNYWAKKDGYDFWSYYDGEDFCGICFAVINKKTLFIWYLAVNDKMRSCGYGSAILNDVKEKYAGCEITLNVEPLYTTADNYEQRVKRIAFYARNGFLNTEKIIKFKKDDFLVLSTKKDFDEVTYKEILRKLSFGFFKPNFTQENK